MHGDRSRKEKEKMSIEKKKSREKSSINKVRVGEKRQGTEQDIKWKNFWRETSCLPFLDVASLFPVVA